MLLSDSVSQTVFRETLRFRAMRLAMMWDNSEYSKIFAFRVHKYLGNFFGCTYLCMVCQLVRDVLRMIVTIWRVKLTNLHEYSDCTSQKAKRVPFRDVIRLGLHRDKTLHFYWNYESYRICKYRVLTKFRVLFLMVAVYISTFRR
jgi:hypothetical protein